MRAVSLALVLAGVTAGCNNPRYLEQNRPLETQDAMQALLEDSDLWVLPARQPTADEAARLAEEQTALGLPMAVPWLGVRDVELQIEWTLKNLENRDIEARVTIN